MQVALTNQLFKRDIAKSKQARQLSLLLLSIIITHLYIKMYMKWKLSFSYLKKTLEMIKELHL